MRGNTSTVLAALSLSKRELVRFYRQRSRVVGVVGSPLLFWLLIGSGLGNSFRHPTDQTGMNYLEYFFPGTIVLIILFTSIFSTISIIEDRQEGFLQSVLVAPVSRTGITLGKILGGTTLASLQAMLMLLVSPFLGITWSLASIAIVLSTILMMSFGLTGLGFLIAWKMNSTQGFHAIMNLFLIPLWLLSGALFPASGAAGWLHTIMNVNPLSYGFTALREGLYYATTTAPTEFSPLPVAMIVTAAFALLTFVLSVMIVHQSTSA